MPFIGISVILHQIMENSYDKYVFINIFLFCHVISNHTELNSSFFQVISKAVSWVLKHQLPEGSFYEVAWFHDRKINSTLSWPDNPIQFRNISLTAHVLIMLETVKDLTGVSC